MNLIVISEELEEKVLNDIWTKNSNYYIVNSDVLYNDDLQKLLKGNNVILSVRSKLFEDLEINETGQYFIDNNLMPIFLNRNNESFTHIMFLALEELFPDGIEYTINEENVDYDLFLDLCKFILWEGIENFEDEDTVIPTPGRGEE